MDYTDKSQEILVNPTGENGSSSFKIMWDSQQATLLLDIGPTFLKYPPESDIYIPTPDLVKFQKWTQGGVVKGISVMAGGTSLHSHW